MTSAVAAGAETSQILMPGGGVARRPLHFIVLANCSGSMKGEKRAVSSYGRLNILDRKSHGAYATVIPAHKQRQI